MNKPIYIALLGLSVLIGFYTTALAQPVYVPQPQPAAQAAPTPAPAPESAPQPRPAPAYVAPAPFGGLYNTISGQQPPASGAPRPLTPFNTQPIP
jgi:hypothetical protein